MKLNCLDDFLVIVCFQLFLLKNFEYFYVQQVCTLKHKSTLTVLI